ncbi:BQ2448_6954 [Microbotryum intermedium]|uniref:BQ2448_6954 protein n=1 Tax=Microbotryum intermedium TaxID=269621 RepID=A0A238FJR5_9BASI|nr:BQ2448_6954 [Microbotryum intermedium]
MMDRAGVLQRPRRHPHPGALPPKYQFVNYYAPARPMERMTHFSTFSLNREPETTIRIIAGDLNDCPNVAVDRKSPAALAEGRDQVLVANRPHPPVGTACSSAGLGDYVLDAPLSEHRPVSVTIACPSAKSTTAVLSLPETSSQADEAFAACISLIIDTSHRSDPLDPLAAFEEAMTRLKIAALKRRTHALEVLAALLDHQKRAGWQDSVSMNKRLILERARQIRIRAHIPELSSEEQLSHTSHDRLAARRTAIKIDALRLMDKPISTDPVNSLEHVRNHFQSHHTPNDRASPKSKMLALPFSILFMRPMTQRHTKLLEESRTADEFVAAIGKTDKGRSLGVSGNPYEMY